MLRITRLLAALMLVLAVGPIGFSPRSSAAPAAKTVTVRAMDGNMFSPATVTINVGDTVTWVNADTDTPHNSVSNDDLWDSGNMNSGAKFSHTFDTAGTFAYTCTYHAGMNGTVIVKAAGGAGADEDAEPTPTPKPSNAAPDDDDEEMPEHAPDTGAGGLASAGLPVGQLAALFSLLLASGWMLIRKR